MNISEEKPELLLIATSARALLESAIRSGYRVAVIDGFCDREVMQHAVAAQRVNLREEGGLDDAELADAITTMRKQYPESIHMLVTGSGIEGCEGALEIIRQSNLLWLGNHNQQNRFVGRNAFKLQSSQIMPMPDNQAPYLYKSTIGSGGTHIYRDDGAQKIKANYYRQSYLPLMNISHLFLADGNQIETVGFSTQWHSKHDSTRPFCYGGAINAHSLNESCIAQAEAAAKTFNLIGLNNIDYLYDGTKLYFLELNPRPSATMALYDQDYAKGLLHAHIKACTAKGLARRTKKSSASRAFAIFYTDDALQLPSDFEWPIEAKDVPVEKVLGYRFEKHAPICTMHAEANNVGNALADLQRRIRDLQRRISQISQTIQPHYKHGAIP